MKFPAFLGGIRGKLIAIFVPIQVVPLILLAWFAWHATRQLDENAPPKAGNLADAMLSSIKAVGETVTDDSIRAIDLRSREAIEALTTDAAKGIAGSLYDRDIIQVAGQEPSEAAFRRFLAERARPLHAHAPWKLAEDGKSWVPTKQPRREAKLTRPIQPGNARDVHVRPPEYRPAVISADQMRLRQILNNLLSNAVKFPERGEVALSVSRTADGIAYAIRGTDLGLTLVKQRVEHMGGQVGLEPTVGAGSNFSIQLPEEPRHV